MTSGLARSARSLPTAMTTRAAAVRAASIDPFMVAPSWSSGRQNPGPLDCPPDRLHHPADPLPHQLRRAAGESAHDGLWDGLRVEIGMLDRPRLRLLER